MYIILWWIFSLVRRWQQQNIDVYKELKEKYIKHFQTLTFKIICSKFEAHSFHFHILYQFTFVWHLLWQFLWILFIKYFEDNLVNINQLIILARRLLCFCFLTVSYLCVQPALTTITKVETFSFIFCPVHRARRLHGEYT